MSIPTDLTDLSLDAEVELYTLDLSTAHKTDGSQIPEGQAQVFTWTPGTIGDEVVKFGGVAYQPLPIYGSGYGWNGQGSPPLPKLQVMNIGGIVAGATIEFDDLVGATVTRIRTFRKHLDGQEEADPNTHMEPDIYRVNRKSLHNPSTIEFELSTPFEQLNKQVPSSMCLRNTCRFHYRRWVNGAWVYGTCPYAEDAMFDGLNQPTTDPSKDVCCRRMSGCTTRYGQRSALPLFAFPGLGLGST